MTKSFVKEGMRWRIGSRRNIPLWNSPSLRIGRGVPCPDFMFLNEQNMVVKDLWHNHSKAWNAPYIRAIFPPDISAQILETPLNDIASEDNLFGVQVLMGATRLNQLINLLLILLLIALIFGWMEIGL